MVRSAKLRRFILLILLVGAGLPFFGLFHNVYAPGTWTTAAPLPQVVEGAAGAVVNGLIYVLKGYSFGDTGAVRIYSPTTNTWTFGNPSVNTASEFYQGATVNNLAYVIGGRPTFSLVDIYNPATNTWSQGAPMPTPRAGHATAVINGKIYVIGGRTGGAPFFGTVLNTLEIYDPATNTWTAGPPMPTARSDLSSAVIGSTIYAIGGWNGFMTVGTVEAFDTLTNSWSTRASMPTPRGDFGAGVCGSEGTIRAIGGAAGFGNTTLTTNEAFNPFTNIWTADTPMNVGRAEVTVVNLDPNTIYAIGGGFEGISFANNEVFHCPVPVKPPGPSLSISASRSALTLTQGSSVNSTITVSSVNGFKGKVSLSAQVQPGTTGITTSFSSPSLDIHSGGSATSLLFVAATLTSSLGTIGIGVTAISLTGNVSASTGLIVMIRPSPAAKIPDFTITSTPSSITVPVNSIGVSTIILNSINGLGGTVTLGVTTSFFLFATTFPNSIPLTPNGVSSVLLLVQAPVAPPPGVVPIATVSASVFSNGTIISHHTDVRVNVEDFTLGSPLSFSTVTVSQGTSKTFPLFLTAINGFSGTVTLSAPPTPPGITITMPSAIFLSSNSTAVATLTISVGSNATGGTFTSALFASSGPLVHAFPFTLIVPDFTITLSTTSLTVTLIKTLLANATITLTSVLGFNGQIHLNTAWVGTQPPGVLVSVAPQTLQLAGTASSLLQVTLTKDAVPGSFTLRVSGVSGGLARSVTITITIVKKL